MTKQAKNTLSDGASPASMQRWPKVIAAPALWETGASPGRQGKVRSYRPRRLALHPTQRASLW